jgi:hypothetical protein
VQFEDSRMQIDKDGFTYWVLSQRVRPLFPDVELRFRFPFKHVTVSDIRGAPIWTSEVVPFKAFAMDMPPLVGTLPLKDVLSESPRELPSIGGTRIA